MRISALIVAFAAVVSTSAPGQSPAPPANDTDYARKFEYVSTMLTVQRTLIVAFHAGICRLRSERYFIVFRDAQFDVSQQEAQRLGLSAAEVADLNKEVNAIIAREQATAGEFDLTKGCADLRNSATLDALDQTESRLIGNYH